MQVEIKFNTDNDTFAATHDVAVANTLEQVAEKLRKGHEMGMQTKKMSVFDTNGNVIGEYKLKISRKS